MPQEEKGEMPELTGTPAGNPPTGAPPAGDPPADNGTPTTLEQAQADLAAARAALKAANNESADRRKKLEKLEADEKKRAEAEMTEVQRLQKENADLKAANERTAQQAKTNLIKAVFVAEAAKLGVLHPEDAFALADMAQVSIDDNGTVTGADKAVKALVDAHRLPVKSAGNAPDINAQNQGGAGKKTADELKQDKLKSGMYAKM